MYTLAIDNNRAFLLKGKDGAQILCGDINDVWAHMVFELEIKNTDIIFAMQEMSDHQHNAADFGVLGGFILTRKVNL